MNNLYQSSWKSLQAGVSSWACASCRRALTRARPSPPLRKSMSSSTAKKQSQSTTTTTASHAASMDRVREFYKLKNRTTMYIFTYLLPIYNPPNHAREDSIVVTGTTRSASSSALSHSLMAPCPCIRWYAVLHVLRLYTCLRRGYLHKCLYIIPTERV